VLKLKKNHLGTLDCSKQDGHTKYFPKAPTDVVYCLIIAAEVEYSARGGLGAFAVHEGGDRPVAEII